MSTKTLDAREYLRVSYDHSGRERSNEEQHAENAAAFPDWRFGKPYRDVGSASRLATRRRDDFDVLIADLAADRFGAPHLVLWESSRGSRQVGEWVQLIELCERRGVKIAVTTHGPRIYDPANPRDRRSLLEDAVDGEYEAAKTSVRARRAAAANAGAGKPHGPPPYGYRRVRDPETGRSVGQELHPAEAPLMVEMFERVAAGHSLRAVAADMADRGVVGRRGRPMTAATMREMLLSPTYIGERVHYPGTKSRADRKRNGERRQAVDGTWPALVPTETFLAVRHRLSDPARRTSRPGRGVHLLSMIARCDACGSVLAATFRDGTRRQYQCHTGGHVRIDADKLDQVAEDELLDFLTRPDNVERLAAEEGDDEALAQAREAQALVRDELDDLADKVGRGLLTATFAARSEPQILARLAEADQRVADLSTPSTLRGLIDPAGDVKAQWEALPMSAKRELARMLLVPEMLAELRVTRSPSPGHPAPAEDRVIWRRI